MKIRYILFLFIITSLCSCQQLQEQIRKLQTPSASSNVKEPVKAEQTKAEPVKETPVKAIVDEEYENAVKEFVRAYEAVPDIPEVPSLPNTVVFNSEEQAVNKEAKVFISSEAVIEKGQKIAVLATSLDPHDIYVADALFASFRQAGVNLIDREYEGLQNKEHSNVQKSKHLSKIEKDGRFLMTIPADYAVLIHRVKNSATEREIKRTPIYLEEQWKEYSKRKDAFMGKLKSYNKKLEQYTELSKKFLIKYPGRITKKDISKHKYSKPLTLEGKVQNMQEMVAGQYNKKRPEGKKISDFTSFLDMFTFASLPQTPPASSNANDMRVGNFSNTKKLIHDFESFKAYLFSIKEPLTAPAKVESLSIRIINLNTSKAVWFGLVEGQHLSRIEAVKKCCEALVKKIVK